MQSTREAINVAILPEKVNESIFGCFVLSSLASFSLTYRWNKKKEALNPVRQLRDSSKSALNSSCTVPRT